MMRASVRRFQKILEPVQIAEWVIEQMDHSLLSRLEGRCEAASYDMSGNCWKYFGQISKKISEKNLRKILENEHQYIHLDQLGLDDFDALVVGKLLAHRNQCAKLLDLNNNPQIGDEGFAHVVQHALSSSVHLRSLFASGCNISDAGVANLKKPLRLQILELRKNSISDQGALILSEALAPVRNDFSLFLNDNPAIGEAGAVALAKAVIESQGNLRVWLKDSCPNLSPSDKVEISKFTKNKIRF